MTQGTPVRPRGTGRSLLHDSALRLFARDGVEGTSLQAIADEMGVTKAAVYYHYKSKEDLVLGVISPIFDELAAIVARAGTHRGRAARLDEIVVGIVDLVVAHRSRYAVFIGDPYVSRLLEQHLELLDWWNRILALVLRPDGDHQTRTALILFLSGLTAPLADPQVASLDDELLRDELIECGRRLLQLRRF
jgi:AcrR family transcriptional regulator